MLFPSLPHYGIIIFPCPGQKSLCLAASSLLWNTQVFQSVSWNKLPWTCFCKVFWSLVIQLISWQMVHFIVLKVRGAPIVTVNYLQDSAVLPLLGAGHSEETHSARFPFLLFYRKLRYRNHTWYLHLPSRKNSSWPVNTPPILKRKTWKSTHVWLYCTVLQQWKGQPDSHLSDMKEHTFVCTVEFYNNKRVMPDSHLSETKEHTCMSVLQSSTAIQGSRMTVICQARKNTHVCSTNLAPAPSMMNSKCKPNKTCPP